MKPVFTSAEMKRCDTEAITSYGIPGIALMENASMGAVELIEQEKGAVADKRFFILCGPGNNGGDGYAMARHLLNRNASVHVFLLKPDEAITGDAAVNLTILRKMQSAYMETLEISLLDDISVLLDAMVSPPDMVIDAMLGTGLQSDLRGIIPEIIDAIVDMDVPVFAVDIPTGINADTGEAMGAALPAEITATMGGLKRGLIFREGRIYTGDVHIIDIGTPSVVFENKKHATYYIDSGDINMLLPWRSPLTHKYEAGSVFFIAGSAGLTGAAALASESCLRSGAGIVKLGVPASLHLAMETKTTEVMTVPLGECSPGHTGLAAIDTIMEYLSAADIGAIGPGLGREPETLELARTVIAESPVPLVIDADALFALADHLDILSRAQHRHILTPHLGEFRRLMGISKEDLNARAIEYAREFAMQYKVILVLKGAPTVTAVPQGTIYINSTGNAGMATAGAGDVLTGITAAFLAQFHDDWAAALSAVHLHGAAGDQAAETHGEMGMIASDIVSAVPGVLKAAHC